MSDKLNNLLEMVNVKGKKMKTVNTQYVLLECLTDDMLNPLLHKFESNQIVKDIYDRRKDNKDIKTDYRISTNIVMKNSYDKPSLYINYSKDNQDIFHLSLHICPSVTNSSQSILHFKQHTISKNAPRRAIRIARNVNTNSIVFSLNKTDKNISSELLLEANIVLDVLNSYFYKKSTFFIQNKNIKMTQKAKNIKLEMNRSYKKYKGTKRKPQY